MKDVSIDEIIEAAGKAPASDTEYTWMLGVRKLAEEVKRLRGDNEILRAKVCELKRLENIGKILSRQAILDAIDNFRAAIEAVKE